MRSWRQWLGLTLAGAMLLGTTVVGHAANSSPKGQVTVGLLGGIETLNPILSENFNETNIQNGIFEGLFYVDEKGNYLPGLAVEIPTVQNGGISKDGLTYTFKLRRGVTWHDGKPFTAEDVKWNWEIRMHPDVAVVSTDGWNKVKKVDVLDPYTIRFTLSEPYASFLLLWSGPVMVPKHAFDKVAPKDITKGQAFSRNPIGTGPFKFKEWKDGSHVILEANTSYWGEGPYLERVIFRFVPDSNTLLTMVRTGEVDVTQLQATQYTQAKTISRVNTVLVPAMIYAHITFNLDNPIFQDVRVRQALTYALPRHDIVSKILQGVGTVAASSTAPPSWAFNPNVKPLPFDLNKAKQLLDEAGWKDTDGDGIREKNGRKLSFTISTNQENFTRVQIEQVAQQYWKQIGADLQIRNYEGTTLFGDILENKKFDLILFAWVSPPDPDETTLYHSSQIVTATNKDGQNYAGYRNAEVDKLLDEAKTLVDQEERKKRYWRIQEIVAKELPMIYLYYYTDVNVAVKNLVNFRPQGTTLGYTWNMFQWKLQ